MVAPSILSADFGKLKEEIISICEAGCDLIHIDVMDGYFVPNMTIGPIVVSSVKEVSTKPLDIHLMVEDNNFFVDLFSSFKPEFISFHIESEKHPHRLIQKLKSLDIKASVALNPHTDINVLKHIIKDLDMVLIMSVNPGFGGQSFIEESISKIKELKELIIKTNSNALIEVDGGVNDKNAKLLKEAGADILVSGSYIFKNNYKEAILSLK